MISAYPARQKKRWLLLYSHTRPGTDSRAMFRQQPEHNDRLCWEKSPMPDFNRKGPQKKKNVRFETNHLCVPSCPLWFQVLCLLLCGSLLSCAKRQDANTLVMIIES